MIPADCLNSIGKGHDDTASEMQQHIHFAVSPWSSVSTVSSQCYTRLNPSFLASIVFPLLQTLSL